MRERIKEKKKIIEKISIELDPQLRKLYSAYASSNLLFRSPVLYIQRARIQLNFQTIHADAYLMCIHTRVRCIEQLALVTS